MDFTSHSEQDQQEMLAAVRAESVDQLIRRLIPEKFFVNRLLDLPKGASEFELTSEFKRLAVENNPAGENISFLGGGSYDHYIPAALPQIIGRSEFYTAYTPYQAEVAQGTLQTIYEFQTMVCRLTGMDTASASLYDGATALAEGVLLAVRKTKRNKVALPFGLNPNYRQVLKTYCEPSGIELINLKGRDGRLDLVELESAAAGAGALVVQHPNFFGQLEPVREATQIAYKDGAMVVASTYPLSLALLEPPGTWGADIATAEGQPFGAPMALGGPYLGLFAVKQDLVRLMPGRIVARARDKNGKDGFVLSLQTREQHIRREKATSNICTNEALVALSALVYLSLVGPDGLKRASYNSWRGAHYVASLLEKIPGCRLRWSGEYFSEFIIELPKPAREVREALAAKGIFIGPDLEQWYPDLANCLLVAVTEKRSKEDCDLLAETLREVLR